MEKRKTATSVRFEDDNLLKKISLMAESNKRSKGKQIEFILEKYVKDYEKENGTINISEKSNS